ncbi:MAG: Uncharacterized protein FD166_2555 [Bacteroidetes bacterium]|nr:MAG: Uncharacterized protein FD166_2555 [Bacteroidota bacterium]
MKKLLLAVFAMVLWAGSSWGQSTIFTQNFDGAWTNPASLSPAWSGTSTPANNEWHMNTYTTGWSGTSGAYTPTGASSTTQSARFHSYDATSGSTGDFITPTIDFSGYTNYKRLTFFHINTSGTDVVNVFLSTDNGTTWGSSLVSIGTSSVWTQFFVSLGNTTSNQVKVRFTATSDFGTTDIGIDQVLIQDDPSFAPMSGTYTIDPAGSGSENFASFSAAINRLNGSGISGAVTFNVAAGAVFNEKPAAITTTGTAVNTITFQKSGSGANPKLVPTGTLSSSPYDFGFCISGGDYITFDGIDVDASGATSTTTAIEYGYLIRNASATNGAQYNTVKNCSVTLNKNYIATTGGPGSCILSTVNSTGGGVVPSNATGANSYNKFYNLTLQNAQNGVYLMGNTSYPDLACEVGVSGTGCQTARNTITNMGGVYTFNAAYGIYTSGLNGVRIFNNDISNIRSNQSTTSGILCISYLGTSEIYNNKVSDISNSGSTTSTARAAGIEVQNSSGTPTIRVYNNFISDIKSPFTGTATANVYAYGIYANNTSTATVAEIDNNSVHLFTTGTPTYSLACFAISNASTAVHKVRGNVFVNAVGAQGATARHTCWYSTSATAIGGTGSVSNYNDMFIKNDAGTSGFVGRGNTTYYNTVANWTTATTQDANSISVDPAFAANNNLHASAAGINAVSGFSTQAWVTTDIDCDDRSLTSPADLGADAFNLASCAMPTGLTASNQTYTTADLSWTAPGTGTPVGYEWEVRTSGAGGSGATGLFASGSTTHPAVAASVTGLSGGTTYTLYVRTFCGGSDYSAWASNTFSTLSCNLPTGVVVSAVTASSATLTWVAPVSGSPAGYEWEVRSSGAAGSGSTGLAASGSTTSPIVTAGAAGLTSSTAYSVYVRTMCYTGFYSSWTSAVTFTTLCAPISTLPHTELFAIYLPSTCWNEGDLGDLTAGPTTISATASSWAADGFLNSGSTGAAKINIDATGDNDWIISPQFSLPASPNQRLKYSVGATQWNGTGAPTTAWETDDYVQVLISTSGYTNWTVLKTFNNTNVPSHLGQIEILDLTAYAGQTISVAYRGVEGTSDGSADIDFFIDNFIIEALPSCVEPSALNATNVTSNSATLNWTPALANPSSFFDIFLSTSATPPTSGTTPTASVGSGVSTYPTGSVLSANTTYYFWARSDCGSGLYSTWTGPLTFFTGYCIPAPTSVDGSGITRVVFSTVNNPSGDETGHYGNYTALVGNVGQGMTIPVDITFATGYTYDTKIWIDWNDDLDFTDSGEEVFFGTSLSTNPTTLNATFVVPVSATLGNHQMRIGGVDSGPPTPCYTGAFGTFEDYTVNVILPPSCLSPTALSASNIAPIGADLSWSSPDSFFDIFIEVFGAPAPLPGTTPTIDDNEGTTYTWKDGSPATTYQYYVRADCSQDNTDVSDWAGPFEFTTLCAVASTPFIETTEGSLTCWGISGGTYNWLISSNASGYGSGTKSFIANFYGIDNPTPFYLFSPEFDAGSLTNPVLEFDYAYATYTGGEVDELKIYYSTDAGATSTLLLNMPGGTNGVLNTGGTSSSGFVPTASQWATRVISLPAGTNMVIFGGISDYGNNLYIDNIEIKDATTTATWSGTASNKWYVATNWTPSVPGSGTNVIIPGGLTNYPTLTAAASCNNFTIQSGGSFIGSEFLTVGGTTTIERSIDAYSSTTASDGWHLVSSPVASQAISGAWTPATGYDFYALDESVAEYWLNKKNHPEMTSFIPGKGYLVAYEVAGVKTFSGVLNSAAVTMSGLTNTPGDYAGSHLVGNPFTSAINAASLTGTNVAANVQVWNSANAAYEVAATIPALNGFMVYTTGSGELTIPLAARTHTGPAWFKSGSEDMILLQANDLERNMAQKSIVRFNTQATEAFDMEFDAYYLAGFAPMFYSKSADEGYALNTLPVLTNETVIPFDFIKNESSEFKIELVQAVPGAIIYLTDKKANKVVNLTETQLYQFTAVEGDVADRFLLTFGAVGIDNPDASRISIYGYRDLVYINGATAGSEVKITNLLGQEMIRTSVNGSELNTINAGNLASGVYVVSIISGNSLVSKKVVLEK